MSLFHQVNPETFIDESKKVPEFGRGAWTRSGIDFDYRYALSEDPAQRIGTRAEVSLAHWATAAATYAIQRRLVQLDCMAPVADSERGIFGPRTEDGVKRFQLKSKDPDGSIPLVDDGTVGKSDARALFYPILRASEREFGIPTGYLTGQTNHESALDPGAIGYYIYYADAETGALEYRGVDRGMSQINSKYNPQVSWLDTFAPRFSYQWSAERLRSYFDKYKSQYPKLTDEVLWDAALCSHNSPYFGSLWCRMGYAPNDTAAKYVAAVHAAIF